MVKDYSPFTPGQPVPLDFFVGRQAQIQEALRLVATAEKSKRLQCVFVAGERGIGKSSFAAFVADAAESKHAFVGVHALLGGVRELDEAVRRIMDRLVKRSRGERWFGPLKKILKDHIREAGLFGLRVEFHATRDDLRALVSDFPSALHDILRRLGPDGRGMLLVLDDINGLAHEPSFAHWLKSFVDSVATLQVELPVGLMLVGLQERRDALIRSQPSLARVFHLIEIQPWSDDETREFFRRTFGEAGVSVDPDAMQWLVRFSGGLPMLAHEIGDATFKTDSDGRISVQDATAGVAEAADIVGRKLLEPQVFRAIRSERYRTILRQVGSRHFGYQFRRADLHRALGKEARAALDNFLRRMRELGVIVADEEGGRGAYRFANRLYYVYLALEAERARHRSRWQD